MASFTEQSIGEFAKCIEKNQTLLTVLFLDRETVYYSRIIESEAFKGCNINKLMVYHIVDLLGKEVLSLTPEFREMLSKAFSIVHLVSDHDVLRYKEKLESDIEDALTSTEYKRTTYLRKVKGDISEIIMVMSSSVDDLNAAVERDFKYMGDNELKKEHLVRYLNLNNKLRSLRKEIDDLLRGQAIERLQRDYNDSELELLTTECVHVFSKKGTDLLKLLTTINIYITVVNKKIADLEKLHRIKALMVEGTLQLPENSDLKERLVRDYALWHEKPVQHSFNIPLQVYRESPALKDLLDKAKIRHDHEIFRSQPAGPVDSMYSQTDIIDKRKFNPNEIIRLFLPSRKDLFTFIEEYDFGQRLTLNEKINCFVSLTCEFHEKLDFGDTFVTRQNREILMVYAKN